jgi:hypothetical protein
LGEAIVRSSLNEESSVAFYDFVQLDFKVMQRRSRESIVAAFLEFEPTHSPSRTSPFDDGVANANRS